MSNGHHSGQKIQTKKRSSFWTIGSLIDDYDKFFFLEKFFLSLEIVNLRNYYYVSQWEEIKNGTRLMEFCRHIKALLG